MKREDIISRIYELHEQLQKTDFGSLLTSRVQLEGQLKSMDHETLMAALRFYESLNEQ